MSIDTQAVEAFAGEVVGGMTDAKTIASLRMLDGYLENSGNDNDRVDLLIAESITLGTDTRKGIHDALQMIGRNPRRVMIRLSGTIPMNSL